MELLIKSNDELRRYIANVVHEVDDETLLYDKMRPFIEQAQLSIERRFIGDIALDDEQRQAACALVAIDAFYHAIPSLDLVLTPNGFGIVSSTNIAPASKERVDRLRASLVGTYDKWADNLLTALSLNERWRVSEVSLPFRRSLLWHLDDAAQFKRDGETLYDAFMRVQPFALAFERSAQSDYLGGSLMALMRGLFGCAGFSDGQACLANIVSLVKAAEKRWIAAHHSDAAVACPARQELWTLMRGIVLEIQNTPALNEVWAEDMGALFAVGQSEILPSKKGGCWL